MRVHISLDLTLLNTATFSSIFYLEFNNITNLINNQIEGKESK